jgi:RNA polymerase sigma-70 factor (ECF subfamily)
VTGRSEVFYPTAARADGEGFEELFHAHHERVIRVITRVIRDPGRAEEVAVEVFWKFWRTPKAHGPTAAGWLHRTAVRLSLNELRRYVRATRNESLASRGHGTADPEQILAAAQEQEQVRRVLAGMKPRDAELLLLRSSGFSYEDVAAAMRINPASVGTLISRAQQAFRKDYVKRYGEKP